ncbi:hypothetical protein [Thermomonas sp.]|uniref:hypothetical protein n=1 Tax=Thermomonas sp. TaxID=1971895 RepID=UPI003D0B8E89
MKPVAVALVVLMLSSCDMLRGNKFEITNETGHELEDVRVSFADAGAQRQSLGPGETLSFRPSPDHDGGISVSYVENGKKVKHDLGYAAPPISMKCEFQITSTDILGDCR